MHAKAIFFDLYQTLIDVDASREKEGKEAGFERVIVPYLLRKGVPKADASLVLPRYSDELQAFYRGHDAELLQHSFPAILAAVFTRYYGLDVPETEMGDLLYEFRKVSRGYLRLYAGAREALEALSARYTLAVASHTQSVYTERELEELGILRYFQHRIYSSDIGFRKRSDDFYRKCLEVVGLDPKDCAMVGDNLYEDVYMASRSGMHAVWVTNPLTKGESAAAVEPEATLTIESLGSLPGVIAGILG
jgi:HAD superfamily hydrolase (TIGR01509 family)